LKELGDKVQHHQNKNQKREHDSALKEDKLDTQVCFCAKNFRIRYYNGIISWNVFLHFFTFIIYKCKDMKCNWRSDAKVLSVNHSMSYVKGDLVHCRLRHAFEEEHLAFIFLKYLGKPFQEFFCLGLTFIF